MTSGVQVYGVRVMGCIAICCGFRYARGDILCLWLFEFEFWGIGCGALHGIVRRFGI